MAENYEVPQWFVDGKIGVWMHWGVPSAIDENRPNDGSHYGRRMYGPNDGKLYAFVLAPPTADVVIRTLAVGGLYENEISSISMLGSPESLEWIRDDRGVTIQLPEDVPNLPVIGFEITSREK